MNLESLRQFLLICTLLNYVVLLIWFLAFRFAHDALYRMHARWFRLTPEHFDALHYQGMAVYKVGVLLLNLAPYLALLLMGRSGA